MSSSSSLSPVIGMQIKPRPCVAMKVITSITGIAVVLADIGVGRMPDAETAHADRVVNVWGKTPAFPRGLISYLDSINGDPGVAAGSVRGRTFHALGREIMMKP